MQADAGVNTDAAVGLDPSASAGRDFKTDLIWTRLQLRNDKIRDATGVAFRPLHESLRDTGLSLVQIAGVTPRMRRPAAAAAAAAAAPKL